MRHSGFWRRWMIPVFAGMAVTVSSAVADPMLERLMSEGKFQEALDYAEEKLPPVQRDATVWSLLAKANEAAGMNEKALACYLVSWRIDPQDYKALHGSARMYNILNQPENALSMAKKALERSFTAEASWEYARACIALKRPAEAKAALEKVIENDPANMIANRELGVIYFEEKNWKNAVVLLKRLFRAAPDADIAFRVGKAHAGAGEHDSAVVYLKESMNLGGSGHELYLELGRACFASGNFPLAFAHYGKVSAEHMTSLDAYQAALAAQKTGDGSAARKLFEKALLLFGTSTEREALLTREQVARNMISGKNYAGAVEHLSFVAAADPKAGVVGELYFLLADAYQGQKNADKAISALETMITLDPKGVSAYARLAELYQASSQPDKAKKTLETLTTLSPDDPSVYLSLGQYYYDAGRDIEALTHFSKSNELEKSAAAGEGMALAAFRQGRFGSAKEAALAAVELDSASAGARGVLASILMQEKDYQKAQPHLEFMVASKPGTVAFKESLAVCYEHNGVMTRLLALDEQIVKLNPKNTDSRFRLARAAETRKEYESAAVYLKELAALQPENHDVLHRLYVIAMEQRKLAKAADYLSRYIALEPGAEAYRDYGDILYKLKDFDRALPAYRSALKLDPALKGFHKRYAEIVIAKGKQEEVIAALSGVIEAGEADAATYQTLGMVYRKKGDFAKAIEMYRQVLRREPRNGEALAALAASQAAAGSFQEAIVTYEQVILMDTGATDAMRELGDIYYKRGNMPAAMKQYQRYFERVPDDAAVAKRLAKDAFDKGDSAAVVRYLARLEYTAEDVDYGIMYAAACGSANSQGEAIRVLETVKKLKLPAAKRKIVMKMLAEALDRDGQEENAVSQYAAYLALPGAADGDAAYRHASLLEQTDKSSGKRVYQANVKKYPSDYRNFLRLGILLSSSSQMKTQALGMLKKAASLADTVPEVWLELGRAYGTLGREDERLAAYRTCLRSDAQNVEANKAVGIILAGRGETGDALLSLEIANTLSNGDPEVMEPLAMCYTASNRHAEAIELLKKARAARPDDPELRFALFELYLKTGREDEAKREIRELSELRRETLYLLAYARTSIKSGDLPVAQGALEDILAVEADNIDALMLKAKILVLKKEYDEAVEIYKEISYIDQHHAPSICERAAVYFLQSKPQWAETFFLRALKEDPTLARAQLGLARIARMQKNTAGFEEHLAKARELDPHDDEIADEVKKAGLQ